MDPAPKDKRDSNPQDRASVLDDKDMSYGKIMTGLLIPKGSHSNPKRILSGVAFLALVCFFLFAALGRSCHQPAPRDAAPEVQATTRG